MDEPSVLDYVLDKLAFWKKSSLEIPPAEGEARQESPGKEGEQGQSPFWKGIFILIPPLFAVTAQIFCEPENRSTDLAVFFYIAAGASFLLMVIFRNWKLDPLQSGESEAGEFKVRWVHFLIGIGFSVLAFFFFGGNRFNVINLSFWLIGLALVWGSLNVPGEGLDRIRSTWNEFWEGGFRITPWAVLVGVVFLVAAFYRLYLLDQVPPEMFSDHAEKLLDVSDVLGGQYPIFFPRNTGREAFQMYLTAATSRIFGTGISFLSLKLGTALMGLLTLPFIYLLGKEIRSKEVGLIAVFFSGIAYWPNVISRVALRFVLYPAFTAPTLYFLIRGLKKKSWNDFLAAGLFLGLGLHGYSTFRIVPLVIIAVLLVYLLQASSPKNRKMAVISLVLVGVISLIVFLPLARFAVDHYDLFSYRMQTRMSNAESPLPGDPLEIFLSNLWKALIMFQWDNGQIWVHSVTDRPALEVVSAALFSLGVLMLMVRNLRNFPIKHLVLLALALPLLVTPLGFISAGLTVLGVVVVVLFGRSDLEWVDLTGLLLAGVLLITPLNLIAGVTFLLAILLVLYQTREKWNWVEMVLLVLIPLLLLPSALSLAFPEENPSLNRSGGALIPVFLIVALALENIIVNLRSIFPGRSGKWLGYGIALLAALASLGANYRLVFVDYYQQFKTRAWNTSEIGAVIRQFSGTIGDEHQAWVVPYPHWVDTRLVGIQALGRVRDYALWPSEIASTTGAPAPKLYIYKPEDEEAIQVLQELYPDGIIERFESEVEGREFMLYYVLQ